MSIKILLLRSNEEIITEVQELLNPETKESVGYKLHKPFRLEIVSDEGEIVFNREKGYQLSWFPWAPLSKEENYDKNFKEHENVIAGVDSDLDMEQIFKDAEAVLEEDEDS